MAKKILVVDDEALVRKVVEYHLTREGFKVFTANDGAGVLDVVNQYKPDLIILDILMPNLDGIEVCREIRKQSNIPVIFLTSKNDSTDIVLGLGIGGDDYVVKPFKPKELIARVKAVLRRSSLRNTSTRSQNHKESIKYGDIEIDLLSRTVLVKGTKVELANKEFELLALLVQNPNRVFSYYQLMESIWKFKDNTDYRTVMVHINRLRKKIEQDPSNPRYITTVRGIGYKFCYEV